MPRTLTIRRQVYDVVTAEQPCKAETVISLLDGERTPDQIYAALSHLTKGGALQRAGSGYYEIVGEPEEAPEPRASEELMTALEGSIRASDEVGEFVELSELIDELAGGRATRPAGFGIEDAHEKVATCELLEKMLAPHLAGRIREIRLDIERIAHL